jgi:hypothetical protein
MSVLDYRVAWAARLGRSLTRPSRGHAAVELQFGLGRAL